MIEKDDRSEIQQAPAANEYVPPLPTRRTALHDHDQDAGVRRAPITTPLNPDDAPYFPAMPSTNGAAHVTASDAVSQGYVLPAVAPGADLSHPPLHWGWKALVFLLTLGVYLAFVNQQILYNSPPTGDQPFYLMVTMSIVQDGDLNIANQFANHDEDKFYSMAPHPENFVGIPAPYPLPTHNGFTNARPADEQYNFHWPGMSVLIIPAWLIGGLFQLWWPATIVFMCLIGAITALNVFLFAYELTGIKWIAFAAWLPISFSNPVMSYTYLIFTELTCGLFLLYALRRLALGWGANGPIRRLLIGFCIAAIPWVAWRCMPLSAGLFLYAVVQWWRYYRLTRMPATETVQVTVGGTDLLKPQSVARPGLLRLLGGTSYLVVPVVISGILMIWHNLFLYGALFPDNRTPERPYDKIFFWPWQGREDLTHFTTSIIGLLFDQKYGLFIYAPIYILGVAGLIFMFRSARRSDRRLLAWMAVTSLPYLFIIFSFYFWNGLWCPPARFLTTFCPLMAAPLAMSLFAARSWFFRALYVLLAIPGFMLMWPMLIDPRHMWPGNPVLDWYAGQDTVGNPPLLGQVTIDLRGILPFVDPLGARQLPAASGWVTILAVIIVAIAFVLAFRWQRAQRSIGYKPLPFAMQGVTWVVGLLLVGGTWYFTNFEQLQHKTELVEINRWTAGEEINASRGIAYLDGKVYVPDWDTNRLIVFDTTTGESRTLPVLDENGNNPLDHPGDIVVGPGGNLYLLNNSADSSVALLVLTPDGQILRKVQLNNKTQISIGLAFGPDGNMYVSDMTGRRIKVYTLDGGNPLTEYIGERPEGFDNGAGIAITGDGTIYEAEISFRRVNQLNAQGEFVRTFQMTCSPWYVLENGNWLDVSCQEGGLFSINKQSGNIQNIDIDTGNFPDAPTGMTYAPDGTLYVMDGNNLIAYKVQH